ncbi:MAG TPA: helix-turn-helix transcriptional regulator [Candidatus Acidoferrales bacterium]|nr:helix-turn-helix transcriptional regulator [Candidatus Acidoferrales bacterium]
MNRPPPDPEDSGEPFAEIPETDPIRAIVSTILDLVPASHWTFARFKGNGDEDQVLSSTHEGDEFPKARDEFALQSRRTTPGPGIGATLGPLGEYSSGLALLFADSRAKFGILTLLRSAELGPFTSTEIRTLTFALDAASDHLSELRLMESQEQSLTDFRFEHPALDGSFQDATDNDVAQYVLNAELEIVLAWTSENERRVAVTPLHGLLENRLPRVLEETVRTLTTAWTDEMATRKPGIARPVPFLVLRTRPMAGPAGLFIGVSLERARPVHSLTTAAARFRISPREVQVLALLLDGLQLNEIAEQLHIASSTVQDHIKSLLQKTGTENRSEMIGKVLGWS